MAPPGPINNYDDNQGSMVPANASSLPGNTSAEMFGMPPVGFGSSELNEEAMQKDLPGDSTVKLADLPSTNVATVPHYSDGGSDMASSSFLNAPGVLYDSHNDPALNDGDDDYEYWASKFVNVDTPAGVKAEIPSLLGSSEMHTTEAASTSSSQSWQNVPNDNENKLSINTFSGIEKMLAMDDYALQELLKSGVSLGPSDGYSTGDHLKASSTIIEQIKAGDSDIGVFKRFDIAEECLDNFFMYIHFAEQAPKTWAKRIQEEWKSLEKDLPDTIFVRAYESRMDLMRAVIVGAEGTPYHDGLFFFDIFFPNNYPNGPPVVNYHSGGHRINPNLYNCGMVCLSLLGTWTGKESENWVPGVSSILQVLVSIQALILNAEPYFNEPGYEMMKGSIVGDIRSLRYNEKIFIHSLQTMVYCMRSPPEHFKELVVSHFRERAHRILASCKAYLEGAPVGSRLVEGGVKDVVEGHMICSETFKKNLSTIIGIVINSFQQIGAQNCEQFLHLAAK